MGEVVRIYFLGVGQIRVFSRFTVEYLGSCWAYS